MFGETCFLHLTLSVAYSGGAEISRVFRGRARTRVLVLLVVVAGAALLIKA